MKYQIFSGVFIGTSLLCGCQKKAEKNANTEDQPNVVIIYADDLGIGDLSCYGATQIKTPNIDKLADEGLLFSNAYATSATSTPSRYGLLTGVYPWRKENTSIAPGNSGLIIDTATVTLADVFKSAGYATGVIGKWHLGLGPETGPDFNSQISPNAQDIGFDYEFLIPATVDRVPCVFVENGRVVNLDPNDPIYVDYEKKIGDWPTGKENPELLTVKPSQGHDNTIVNGISRIGFMTGGKSALWKDDEIAHTIISKAENFISKNKDNPFFLFFGTHDIHVPRVPHPDFKGKSGMGDRGDVILQFDWTVGRIVSILDSLQLLDNTLIIISSDNGPAIDDGYHDQAFELLGSHNPMGIYRGGKYSAYEAGTRVPFIVYWKNKISSRVQKGRFSQIDMIRSMAGFLNQPLSEDVAYDSRDASSVLLGKEDKDREFIVQQNLNNTLSIIKKEWKCFQLSDDPAIEYWTKIELGNSPKPQLYNIEIDPEEKNNVAEKHPAVYKEMYQLLDSIRSVK